MQIVKFPLFPQNPQQPYNLFSILKTLGVYFKSDNLYSELYEKNFKKTYAGKPTKKYLRITVQIQKAESIQYHEIERQIFN